MTIIERGPAAEGGRIRSFDPPLAPGQLVDAVLAELDDGSRDKGKGAVLGMPTILLRALTERARSDGLDLLLDEEIDRKLNAKGMHQVSQLRRIIEPGRGTFVRGLARLSLTDDPTAKNQWCEWLDFNEANIGSIIAAVRRQKEFEAGRTVGPVLSPLIPRWVGAISYMPFMEQARAMAAGATIRPGAFDTHPRALMAITETAQLTEAHVLRIDPQQVAVLPAWEADHEVFEYAAEANLPFEPLYLDFEEVGGIPPFAAPWRIGSLTISGALLWRQDGCLIVAPVGWPPDEALDIKQMGGGWNRYTTPGWFVFGKRAAESDVDDFSNVHGGEDVNKVIGLKLLTLAGRDDLGGRAICLTSLGCVPSAEDLPGYAILPFTWEELRPLRDGMSDLPSERLAETVMTWGSLVFQLAAKALAALSITEAEEVVIADAALERRDRKRAEKRKWKIAQQVFIRPIRRYADRPAPSGEEARYTHQFWVRATVAHYPVGTRMADARPDLVTPCNRSPESSCGVCRKVKHPAYIKGPEGAPLVLKTLVGKRT